MAPEIGYFALLLALLVSLAQMVTSFAAGRRGDVAITKFIDKAPPVQLFLMAIAFGSLTYAGTAKHDPQSAQAMPGSKPFGRNPSVTADVVAELQSFASEKLESRPAHADVPPVDEMIARLAKRLEQNPKDVQGWRTLGWSYQNTGRLAEASDAYAKAIELAPGDAELRSARIEALVGSADGTVTAEARDAIEAALEIDPKNSRARFFKGLAKEQDGDKAAALAAWRELLRDVDPNESWVSDLNNRIGELERGRAEGKVAQADEPPAKTVDGASQEQQAPLPPEAPPSTGLKSSALDEQAAERMTPTDRSAMIRGMVDRLANRLEKSPHDADGWIRLIQSRMVLGETELAKRALARGTDAFSDDAGERARIIAAARSFGLDAE